MFLLKLLSTEEQRWFDDTEYMAKSYLPFCKTYNFYQENVQKIVGLIEQFNPHPKKLLDLGCGPLLLSNYIIKNFPSIDNVLGYEINPKLEALGLKEMQGMGLKMPKNGIKVVSGEAEGSVTNLINTKEKYDLIVNNNVLYIFLNEEQTAIDEAKVLTVLRNIKNNLSKNGTGVIGTVMKPWNAYKSDGSLANDEIAYQKSQPNGEEQLKILIEHLPAVQAANAKLKSLLTPQIMRRYFKEVGLEVIATNYYYTPKTALQNGEEEAGGVIYLVKHPVQ